MSVGMFIGSFLAQRGGLSQVIPALMGKEDPPHWLSLIASSIVKAGADPTQFTALSKMVMQYAKDNGISEDQLMSKAKLIGQFSPEDAPETLEDLPFFVLQIAKRLNLDPKYKITGLVSCPNCKFTHLV